MKKLITLALLALFGSAAWNSASAVLTQDGEGTYLITSPQDLVDFATLVNGGTFDANAKLQNDIDMTGVAFTPIGLSVDANADGRLTAYMGNFNGNGKTIRKLSIETDDTNLYLIGLFSRVYMGTVSNLILKDVDIITAQPAGTPLATGGIAGIMDTGTLQNCAVIGFQIDEVDKDGCEARYSTGAICGYTISSNSTLVKSCFTDDATPIGALGKKSKVTNVYGAVDVAAKASTGELCYLLNGSQSDTPAWYQTLGSDPYPVLDSSHRVVYNSTAQTCDGTPKGDPTYSDVPPTRDPHNYVDGICSVCSSVDLPQVDGVFQIGTPQQLVYFSNYVNAQHKNVNAVLTADIDLTGINFTPIGLFTDDDADESRRFEGTFDGQGHVISNLYINRTDNYEVGLFSRPTNATIRNLGIKNASIKSVTTRDINSGVFAGLLLHSNMYNCYAIGDISIDITSGNVGGLATMATLGAPTGMYNCYTTYSTCGLIALGTCTLSNCYTDTEVAAKAATGELCYLLNGSQSETPTWYQTIGTDDYPVLDNTHGTVYLAVDQTCDGTPKGAAVYGNMAGVRDEHNFTDGICTVCGAAKEDYLVPEEGVFKIGTPAQLKWFAAYLNHGGEAHDAILTADIDFAGGEMIPIGQYSDGAYGGSSVNHSYGATFDGKGHVIKNVVINNDGDYEVGLFSRKSGGAIQNLGIDGITVTNTSSNPRTGALAGLTHNANITNVYVVNATLTAAAGGETGALAGQAVGGTYTNCYTDNAAAFGGLSANLVNSYGADVVGPKGATGELCYLLNGDQSSIAWYQKIGKDPYPVLIGTDIVYNVDGFGYTNSNLDIAKPAVEGGIYMISTPKELLGFSVLVNQGETEAKAQLKNAIDMDGIAWLPIGDDAASAFKGTFDGAGNDITNLVMAASDANGCSSFIGFADAGCTLKNIPLQGSFTGGQYTAGFVGRVVATAAGTISVIDCTNNATVTSSSTQSAGFFGAVQCPADKILTFELTNCLNNANISGSNQTSGFFGWAKVGDILFTNCDNRGNVTSTGYHVGGFIGRTEKINNDIVASFKNCINYGDVTSPNATSIGGITGRSDVLNSFTDCLNFGDITGAGCVGGLTGNNGATMIRCGNEGRVHGTGSTGELKIGGLFGNGGGACSFTDCYNTGEVVGDAGTISKGTSGSAGGLVGVISASFTMTNCSNSGNVTGYGNNCGGLVGWESSGVAFTIENSWNTGNVSSPDFGENAGGIIGGASGAPTPTIINCYNTGAVTGKINSAGISGWLGSGTPTIQNCWSIGTLTNNGGNNTLYRHKSYTAGTITNNYELSGKVATPTNGAPPAGYTADWLANGALTYHINTTAGERIYNQTIGEDATPILDASHGIVNQITAAGYATQYIADTDVTIPAGVKAYTGKVDGANLKLTEVAEKIPAAAAVVLEGAEGFYSFMPTTGAAAVADNDLVGTATALAADGSQYVLAEKDAVVGFYQATEGTIAAGKAYLTGISAGVKAITFSIADGIASPLSETEEGVIYDLSGRRVEKAMKGLYIINGKKVLK